MNKRTNEEWLSALRASGSEYTDAISDLRRILVTGLRRGLLHRINTSAPEFETQAEDFAQDALLRILDNLDSFAGRSQFTTWAHKITISVAFTELRRKRWQDSSLDALTESESGDYTPDFIADTAPKPENVTERAEMLAHVSRLIEEVLTEKQRTAVTASILQGLPTKEVARQMNMKPNALYKLLHDARLRLKQGLEKDGLTPAEIIAVFE
ncbi:MAG: RNA polymerase sigma factor [Anaerolineales bacterium]|nr:RNA polymerase sigma factor [Anaerolineales bacterium]MCB8992110.1 RNA polymerase sigma factor [Ardenticatenaceae bacterium]